MLKRILLVLLLCFSLTSCSLAPQAIEGFWMAENGDTISFNSDGKAIIDGLSHDYSVYDKNCLSISFWDFAEEYRFELGTDTLTLIDLSNGSTQTFYRDIEKQAEIQENLKLLAAQEQATQEYEEYVKSLKNHLFSVESSISYNLGCINDREEWIADLEVLIQEESYYLEEIKSEITELQKNSEESSDEKIDLLQEKQTLAHEKIDRYKENIETYQNEIDQCYRENATLETEKEKLIKELQDLGEY